MKQLAISFSGFGIPFDIMIRLLHHPPKETCKEYFEKEAAVALDAWRDVRGLNEVEPTPEEIEAVMRSMTGRREIERAINRK